MASCWNTLTASMGPNLLNMHCHVAGRTQSTNKSMSSSVSLTDSGMDGSHDGFANRSLQGRKGTGGAVSHGTLWDRYMQHTYIHYTRTYVRIQEVSICLCTYVRTHVQDYFQAERASNQNT